jgi:outer membrane protein assembly factor BamB
LRCFNLGFKEKSVVFEKYRLSAAAMAVAFVSSSMLIAEDWPTFRGVSRTAVAPDTNLLDRWPEDGPQLLWTAKGAGRGYASPAIYQGRIYTLGDNLSTAEDKDEYLTCFSAEDGSQIWKSKTGPAWNSGNDTWQGSRSTPTANGDHVWVISPFGKLVCAKISDGSIVWERSLLDDLGGKKRDSWGYSESPLIDGNKVICTPGGPKATMVALDKLTGETIWTCSRPDDVGAGHSSIVITEVGGMKVYVQNTGGGPMGVDAETGKLLWSYDMEPPTAFIPTPVIQGDLVCAVAGYNSGGVLLQQVPTASGGVSIKEIYGLNRDLNNKHGGVILVDKHLYAGGKDKNIIYCADLMTGKVLWEERGSGTGSTSVISADGKLFIRFQNGVVALARADTRGYKESGSFTAPGSGDMPSWAHPVISDGKLYLREGDAILCYQISKN